jgi:hypothetical protein
MSAGMEQIPHLGLEAAAWTAVTGCVLILLVRISKWRATARVLRTRIRLAVLPTETFDPNEEEVLRFAHQLTRVHRAVLGFLDRPASAVRIRMESLPDGAVAYLLEGPARAASVLRVGGYEDVELRALEGDEILAPQGTAFNSRSAPDVAAVLGRGSDTSPPSTDPE